MRSFLTRNRPPRRNRCVQRTSDSVAADQRRAHEGYAASTGSPHHILLITHRELRHSHIAAYLAAEMPPQRPLPETPALTATLATPSGQAYRP
jgi:hypothetical protein